VKIDYNSNTSPNISFLSIDSLCRNTQQLVEEYPLIRDINTIRVNLMSTHRSMERHLEIPEKVSSPFFWILSKRHHHRYSQLNSTQLNKGSIDQEVDGGRQQPVEDTFGVAASRTDEIRRLLSGLLAHEHHFSHWPSKLTICDLLLLFSLRSGTEVTAGATSAWERFQGHRRVEVRTHELSLVIII